MIYNFGAGPGMLPSSVLARIKEEIPDWHNGMSVMEISHRSKEFISLVEQAEQNLRKLLNIPANYHILFLPGGARAQFTMVPMNLLWDEDLACYLITGFWSKLAYEYACQHYQVNIVATSEKDGYLTLPPQSSWDVAANANYLHYVDNETINGVEFYQTPDVSIPLVADMTSSLLSKPIDVSRYAVIYASAQKNFGIAGLTVVIVREDCLKKGLPSKPLLYDYNIEIMHRSMLNTPPIFAWYVSSLVFEWLLAEGGVEAIAKKNSRKAKKLYAYIDNSDFYENRVAPSCRSRMNVVFQLQRPELEEKFLQQAELHGCMQLKGHKLTGGIRASIYNAMPEAGVDTLIEFMREFEQSHAD